MKKNKAALPPTRPLYALLLVAAALLLWLLAQPRPGLRIVRLPPVLAPEAGTPPHAISNRLRIATYNLEHFTDGRHDEPERTPEVFMTHARAAAEIIAEANPDILVLQEIENGRTLEFLNEQFADPYRYVYISKLRQTSGEKERLNLALLSRLRPRNVRQLGFYNLGGKGRPARGSLAAEFDLGDDLSLLVYNIHLKSNYGEAPKNQAQRAIALHHIAADAVSETLQNDPDPTAVLILGDTNVDPDTEAFATDPSLEPLAGGFVDLWRGRPIEERTTIPARQAGETGDPLLVFPPSAFDRVFVSRNLAANGPWKALPPQTLQKGTDTTNNLTQPGFNGHVSDHHLVYVDLAR
jgi:endonuclease/exonuclease/phosphatase family metal-dependent hydrolase